MGIKASQAFGADRPRAWGPWVLDDHLLALENGRYYVRLLDCTTSARTLDWIAQVATKPFADDEVVAGLVRALNDILAPQATLCSGGQSGEMTADQIKQRVALFSK